MNLSKWQSVFLILILWIGFVHSMHCMCVGQGGQIPLSVDETPLIFQGMHFWGIKQYHRTHPGLTGDALIEEIACELKVPIFVVKYVLENPELPIVALYDQDQVKLDFPDWSHFYRACRCEIVRELDARRLYGQISNEARSALSNELAAQLGLSVAQIDRLVDEVWNSIELVMPPIPRPATTRVALRRSKRKVKRYWRIKDGHPERIFHE